MEVDENPESLPSQPSSLVDHGTLQTKMDLTIEESPRNAEEVPMNINPEDMAPSPFQEALLPLNAESAGSSLENIDSDPSQSLASGNQPIVVSEDDQEDEEASSPKARPVTRQMARSSGEEVWPWSNNLPGMVGLYDDDTFVVEEVEMAEKSKKKMFDGLEPPRSLNYLDPTRDEAKKARRSALEQLKQSRATRAQRAPDIEVPTDKNANLQLPIFDLPEDEEAARSPFPRQSHQRQATNPTISKKQDRDEALEVRKRKRDFETPVGDYLPSYGPDFIVDDGSGYSVDPMYKVARLEGRINPLGSSGSRTNTPSRASTSSPGVMSTNHRANTIQLLDGMDDYDDAQSRPPPTSIFSTPTRTLTSTAPSSTYYASNATPSAASIEERRSRGDELATSTVISERSNPASLGAGTASTRTVGPHIGTDSSTAPKLRLTVLIREERFFISCPEESSFSWLQSAASAKYRTVSRMEVDLDHLETNFGARLMPEDKIREYMNDLETVVAIIKESRPIDLAALYKADCASLAFPENPTVLERFTTMDQGETLANGAHSCLPLHGIGLDSVMLPTLFGVLNLHAFVHVDLSSNHLTPVSMVALLQEISKSNGLESQTNFRSISLKDNLIGLSIDVDSAFRSLLGRFTSLTSLDLSENCMNDRAVSALVPALLEQSTNLTSLDLSSNLIGVNSISAIESGPSKFKNLTSLNLARNPIREEGFSCLMRALANDSSLQTLDLSYCNIFSKTLNKTWNTAPEGNLPTIEATVEALGSKLSALTRLSLRGCKIDTWSHPMLLPALCMSLKRIHDLDLADCSLVAHDLRFLKSLLQSPVLSKLNLSYNNLSSERKLALDFVLSAPRQQELALVLQECRLQSEKEALEAALLSRPNLVFDMLGN